MIHSRSEPFPSMTDEVWAGIVSERRQAEVDARIRAGFPVSCPFCGEAFPVPTFVDLDEWQCSGWRCLKIWRDR